MQALGGEDYCKNTGVVIKAFIVCWEDGFNQHNPIWDVQLLGSSLHPPTGGDKLSYQNLQELLMGRK